MCKDGNNKAKLDMRLVELLQKLRDKVGRPITVHSGYRTPEYNQKVGGVRDSQHIKGTAADISIKGMSVYSIAEMAEQIGFDGIGIYEKQGFVHVDVRGYEARWIR